MPLDAPVTTASGRDLGSSVAIGIPLVASARRGAARIYRRRMHTVCRTRRPSWREPSRGAFCTVAFHLSETPAPLLGITLRPPLPRLIPVGAPPQAHDTELGRRLSQPRAQSPRLCGTSLGALSATRILFVPPRLRRVGSWRAPQVVRPLDRLPL